MPKKKFIISKLPAIVWAIFTALSSLFLPFIFSGVVALIGKVVGIHDEVLGNFIAYLCTGIAVSAMCFLICKTYPGSIWYTPVICNIITLWAGLGNYYYEGSPFFNEALPFGIGWILSVIASIWGTFIGKTNHQP